MNNILMKIKNPESMFYETVGDWRYDENSRNILITVADLENDDQNFLILVHELLEWYLCKKVGVTEKEVDVYDKAHLEDDDPGLNQDAPYHKQHMTAFGIEVILAGLLEVNWNEYCVKVEETFEKVSKAIKERNENKERKDAQDSTSQETERA